jgi:hypothetical protein
MVVIDMSKERNLQKELDFLRPNEIMHEAMTPEQKYAQWKNFPKQTRKEMRKETFKALQKQHSD